MAQWKSRRHFDIEIWYLRSNFRDEFCENAVKEGISCICIIQSGSSPQCISAARKPTTQDAKGLSFPPKGLCANLLRKWGNAHVSMYIRIASDKNSSHIRVRSWPPRDRRHLTVDVMRKLSRPALTYLGGFRYQSVHYLVNHGWSSCIRNCLKFEDQS